VETDGATVNVSTFVGQTYKTSVIAAMTHLLQSRSHYTHNHDDTKAR
jgi:hypothetical protein